MAATLAAEFGATVHLFEKRAALGRKLLIAGSSGLNISHEATLSEWAKHYTGFNEKYWRDLFTEFSSSDWIRFIEEKLKLETFLGTSKRYFVREMKASGLLKEWQSYLTRLGVTIHSSSTLDDFSSDSGRVSLSFKTAEGQTRFTFDRALFALGGASWETEIPAYYSLFRQKNLKMEPFVPSNVGYEVDWKKEFLNEAEGKPLKKIVFTSRLGTKAGELMVTKYGLEGTPIYFYGTPGEAFIDLKPDEDEKQILSKLLKVKENMSPIRRVKKVLGLCDGSLALLFHHSSALAKTDLKVMAQEIKRFNVSLREPRPLLESISSKGGLSLSEVSEKLELKQFPGIYCAGEMLDWDAPTGGFLIQACVSQGAVSARHFCGGK